MKETFIPKLSPIASAAGASTASASPADRMSRFEMYLCNELGIRAAKFVGDWLRENRGDVMHADPSALLLSLDFATVHVARPLQLAALLNSDDLQFGAELAAILRGINRPLASFDSSVKLAFAVNAN